MYKEVRITWKKLCKQVKREGSIQSPIPTAFILYIAQWYEKDVRMDHFNLFA